jgi:hypothetical protein
MKTKYLFCLLIGWLSASTSFCQVTPPDRPTWVLESDWIPITKDLGIVIYKAGKHPLNSTQSLIERNEKELERFKKENNQAMIKFIQDDLERLRKQSEDFPGFAESILMARKEGKWHILKLRDTEPKKIFHQIEEKKR